MRLEVSDLWFRYKGVGASPEDVLQAIDLRVDEGEFLALVGASGSGKTTLMQHLTGLLRPDRGRVLVDGKELGEELSFAEARRRIGLVFQFPEAQLFEETLYADVAFGPRNLGLSQEEVHARVVSAFADVELDFERFKDRSPFTLSEGEKRRAAIAGVLAMQPELLVLDEPTAGLDHNGLLSVVQILRKLHAQGKSIVLISHDLELVAALVERIVVLQAGRIRFDGPRAKLLQDHRLMAQLDLTPPRTQRVVQALKRKGLVRNEDLYSLEEIKKEIARTCGVIQNKPVVEK